MATTQIPSFAPTAFASIANSGASSNRVALPVTGTPTIALVSNPGPHTAYIALGTATVVASPTNGLALQSSQSIALTIGANTYIACFGGSLNIAVGN
jgi:hypothetical protein